MRVIGAWKATVVFLLLITASPGIRAAALLLPLHNAPAPEPVNLLKFVKDKPAAIRLGKVLFWDMRLGSDGVQACASCHPNLRASHVGLA